jgi:hypothetical protein
MKLTRIAALDLRRPGLMNVRYDMWSADAELADAHRWLDAALPSWAAGRSCSIRARLHDLEVHHGFQLARVTEAAGNLGFQLARVTEAAGTVWEALAWPQPRPRTVRVVCGSCEAGEHACGGDCDCDCWAALAAREGR